MTDHPNNKTELLERIGSSYAALEAALGRLDAGLRQSLERAARNIAAVHEAFRPQATQCSPEPGVIVGRRPDLQLQIRGGGQGPAQGDIQAEHAPDSDLFGPVLGRLRSVHRGGAQAVHSGRNQRLRHHDRRLSRLRGWLSADGRQYFRIRDVYGFFKRSRVRRNLLREDVHLSCRQHYPASAVFRFRRSVDGGTCGGAGRSSRFRLFPVQDAQEIRVLINYS